MRSVRDVIVARAKFLELGPYDVAKLVKGKMSAQTVYNFLKGRGQMNSDKLGYLLDALDLEFVGGDGWPTFPTLGTDSIRTPKPRTRRRATPRKPAQNRRK